MIDVTISRYETSAGGTRSRIAWLGQTFHGLEPPWLDNQRFKSCIPSGAYTLLPHEAPRFGLGIAFFGGSVVLDESKKDYAERFACLIHPANYARQLQGCLAPGLKQGNHEGAPAVWNSRKALAQMQALAEDRPGLKCRIEWAYATS